MLYLLFTCSECDIGPRFANHGDVEFIIANRWKVVFDDEKAQRAELEARIKDNRAAVRDALSNVHEQHKTEMLRQELVHHQQQQMRLLQQLSEREGGGLMPPMPSGLPPPLFPGDRQEVCVVTPYIYIYPYVCTCCLYSVGYM